MNNGTRMKMALRKYDIRYPSDGRILTRVFMSLKRCYEPYSFFSCVKMILRICFPAVRIQKQQYDRK